MSVWRRFDHHGFTSLITTNVESRSPVFASTQVARLMLRVIGEVRHETRVRLLAFVIMPDHVHLVLATPPPLRLGRVMQLIKGRFLLSVQSHEKNARHALVGALPRTGIAQRA